MNYIDEINKLFKVIADYEHMVHELKIELIKKNRMLEIAMDTLIKVHDPDRSEILEARVIVKHAILEMKKIRESGMTDKREFVKP